MPFLYCILLQLAGLTASAQTPKKTMSKPIAKKPAVPAVTQPPADTVYTRVDIEATFKGSFKNFLEEHLKYPTEAQDAGAMGAVIIEFIVNKNGTVSNIKVAESSPEKHPALTGHLCDIIRKTSDCWKPAIQNGIPVRSWHSQTLNICPLQEEE